MRGNYNNANQNFTSLHQSHENGAAEKEIGLDTTSKWVRDNMGMQWTKPELCLMYTVLVLCSPYYGWCLIKKLAPPLCWKLYIRSCRYKKHVRAKIPLFGKAEAERHQREELNRNSLFMRMPGELRNRIYGLCMPSGFVVDPIWGCLEEMDHAGRNGDSMLKIRRTDPSSLWVFLGINATELDNREMLRSHIWESLIGMTQVSRVWRAEALRYFYGSNIFRMSLSGHSRLHEIRRDMKAHGIDPCRYWRWWLKSRPREGVSCLTLLFAGYPRESGDICSHAITPHMYGRRVTRLGAYMVLLNVSDGKVCPVRGLGETNGWGIQEEGTWECDVCWPRFCARVRGVHESKKMEKGKWRRGIERGKLQGADVVELVNVVRKGVGLTR